MRNDKLWQMKLKIHRAMCCDDDDEWWRTKWLYSLLLYVDAINVRYELSTCTDVVFHLPTSPLTSQLSSRGEGNHYFLVVVYLQLLFRFEQIASHIERNFILSTPSGAEGTGKSLARCHTLHFLLSLSPSQLRLAHPAEKSFIRNVSKNVNRLNSFNECQRQHSPRRTSVITLSRNFTNKETL